MRKAFFNTPKGRAVMYRAMRSGSLNLIFPSRQYKFMHKSVLINLGALFENNILPKEQMGYANVRGNCGVCHSLHHRCGIRTKDRLIDG